MEPDSELKKLQRRMASLLFRPLDADWRMRKTAPDGRRTQTVAAEFIRPNDRLTSFERLEIYNRQYWFRVLDSLSEDYPGLRAILGERRFLKLSRAYLAKYPSESFTLRDLGNRLEKFLAEEPEWTAPHGPAALDMARFEWAQVLAFDEASEPVVTIDELLDTAPESLRLGLQPYISLLKLDHAVDKYFTAVSRRDLEEMRGGASNAMREAPEAARPKRRVRPPRRERVFLVVHRHDNDLYTKRLDAVGWRLLADLRDGRTLAEACMAAVETDGEAAGRLQRWFADWAALGWFCSFHNPTHP